MVGGAWSLAPPLASGSRRGAARPASLAGACCSQFCPSFSAGARRDSSCACALRRWAPRPDRRPLRSPLCACALALPPSRCARLSQSVCRSLSSEQEERRDFREPTVRLFSFPSLSPAPHLSSPLSCPCSRSHGGAVGGHSVPVRVLVVLRARAFGAQRREPWSLPRPGGEELRLLLCGAYLDVDITVSSEAFHNYVSAAMVHINRALKLIIRLFLVEDLVDSLKLAVFMWLMTYVGAVFNGITLLILAELLVFSVPIVYEKYKTQIDHYVGIARDQTKSIVEKIQAKLPGIAKKKAE
uniref:Reticulon n=1 Tax=Suricata suricatta TaxID=37032 RepID=A0A673VNS7_SURSU